MKKEFEQALAEITAGRPSPTSACWVQRLPDDALEFMQTLEEVSKQGKRVYRKIAAEKYNELFPNLEKIVGRKVSEGMIGNHLIKKCTCQDIREYGWPPNKQ